MADLSRSCSYTQRAARIEGDIPLSNRLSVILRTPVSIIAHDGLFFNRRLRKAQYFFADIKKEGICLFDDSSFELAEAKELSPKERQHLAQESFDYWFQSAEEFYKGFNFYLKSGFLSKAAFSLHQVVECLYTTILLVYTNYKLNCHDLKKLTKLVVIEDMKFSSVFPQKTDEQKYRFKLLCKAYKDARYSRGYKITDKELLWLAERIKKLLTLTNHMCRRKIKNFS